MQFFADECVYKTTVELLRARGHEVETVWRTPMSGWEDAALLTQATTQGQLFVTNDKDFANVLLYPPQQTRGIVWLKINSATEVAVHGVLTQLVENARMRIWMDN